jgi:hypothetical protein
MPRNNVHYFVLCVFYGPLFGLALCLLLVLGTKALSSGLSGSDFSNAWQFFSPFALLIAYVVGLAPAALNAGLMIAISHTGLTRPFRIALAPVTGALSTVIPLYLLGLNGLSPGLSIIGAVVSLGSSVVVEVADARAAAQTEAIG